MVGAPTKRSTQRGGESRPWRLWCLSVALLTFVALPSAAQEALTDNNFQVDLIATPALGSSRIIGMAGASTALAEGVDSVPYNPAGYAARTSWERDWWEFELGFSLQFPGAYARTDYFLNGRESALGVDDFSAVDLSGRLQLGDLGFGASTSIQNYRLRSSPTSIDVTTTRLGAGYAFLDGQLVVGAGLRILAFDLVESDIPLVSFTGTSVELGAIIRPAERRWRVGAAIRSPVSATVASEEVAQVGDTWLPRSAGTPWEFSGGFAWQWFERPFNPRHLREKNVRRGLMARLRRRWCERERTQRVAETGAEPGGGNGPCGTAHRPQSPSWWAAENRRREVERAELNVEAQRRQEEFHDLWRAIYESRPRRFFLLSADLIVLGRMQDGVGVDAFVRQVRHTRGANISVGLRVGAETEIWPNHLKIRFGSYLEPARYEGVRSRVHGTAGFDLHLFRFLGVEWRLTTYIDGAARYINYGVSLGTWH